MNNNPDNFYIPWPKKNVNLIFSVNCGSSSIKTTLFQHEKKHLKRLLDANLKGINGLTPTLEIHSFHGSFHEDFSKKIEIKDGLQIILNAISDHFPFAVSSLMGIGHRVVHGGNKYRTSLRINRAILKNLDKLSELAPLHNAACLQGIKTCLYIAKAIPQVIVFDTAFHRTLPPVAAYYAIPNSLTRDHEIERYGFHGISHSYLWKTYAKHTKKNRSKIITLHLGNGCSMAAIQNGKSIDTSMGFTPEEGLVMGTRAGDIDPSVMEFLCEKMRTTPAEVMELFNFHSGLLGVSGISSDMKVLSHLYVKNKKAKLAIDMFCYRIVKYLGAYVAILGGIDAVAFSGGIGENSPFIREKIIQKMGWLGLKIDRQPNTHAIGMSPGDIQAISSTISSAPVFVIATDENFMIAEEVLQILDSV